MSGIALMKEQAAHMALPRSVTVLGATGSIGDSTMDLLARDPAAYRLVAVTAHSNVTKLARIAREHHSELAVIADPERYQDLKDALADTSIEVAAGPDALIEAARRPADWVMAAIVGAAGLPSTLAAVRRGATVALANKETLVCAGELMMAEVERHDATLLPVDSEHNAIFQVFDFERIDRISRILLTASGGPFRTWSADAMRIVTPAQAVAHPNWSMGAKISVDSATMMNKGLELIEAHHLFPIGEEKIEIVVHPQSVVHSMVEYADGSVLAQMGSPDMRTPIAYALAWPDRMSCPVPKLNFAELGRLDFEAPDLERFPALRLAREALRQGGIVPTVLNAANEVAVAAFLQDRLGFLDIARVVEACMEQMGAGDLRELAEVTHIDEESRRCAGELVTRFGAS